MLYGEFKTIHIVVVAFYLCPAEMFVSSLLATFQSGALNSMNERVEFIDRLNARTVRNFNSYSY